MGKRVTITHNKDGSKTKRTTYTSKRFGTTYSETFTERITARRRRKKGCYVATCVYGSYDCPEVWTLRRYRDNELASTFYGRAFIRLYYAISPSVVKLFGNTEWFQKLFRNKLDNMVKRLNADGVENTPYEDIEW